MPTKYVGIIDSIARLGIIKLMIGDEWLSRKEAVRLILSLHYPVTQRRLAHYAINGGGPQFTRSGWRTVHYHKDDVIAWVEKQKARQKR